MTASPPSYGLAILFVDDEDKTCKYFSRLFGDEFPVLTATDARQALRLLETESPGIGIIMTDQRMPARSGVSLLAEVRKRYPRVIRLLTTAYTDIEDAIAAVNRGEIRRYITKPWDVEKLRDELHEAMEACESERHEQELLEERRQTMLRLAGYIAHEMRTPFASIHAAAGGIGRHLPALLEAHSKAVAAGLPVAPLRAERQRRLARAVDTIQHLVDRANAVIDLLLANAGSKRINAGPFRECSMQVCLQAALSEYPFATGEREKLQVETSPDFAFFGPDNLMVYVLFNLFRNALYAVAAADGGVVHIWLSPGEREHCLHVRDTGDGVAPEALPTIFDEFASFRPSGSGTGLGLAFCRRALHSFGGDIECVTEYGEYAEFVVRVPAQSLH